MVGAQHANYIENFSNFGKLENVTIYTGTVIMIMSLPLSCNVTL